MNNSQESLYKYLKNHFRSLQHSGLWPTSLKEPTVFHAHNNLLVALGLWSSGHRNEARATMRAIFRSPLNNRNGLLNYSYQREEGALARHHSHTMGMAAYVLAVTGDMNAARKMLNLAFASALYQNETNLFIRSIWADGSLADKRLVVHSNLWFVLALLKLGEPKKAQSLLHTIEKLGGRKNDPLLRGVSCEFNTTHIYPDDNALYAICLRQLNHPVKARRVLRKLRSSSLYNPTKKAFVYDKQGQITKPHISSYKNHIVQAAFAYCGLTIPTYNFHQDNDFSDAIALGFWRV